MTEDARRHIEAIDISVQELISFQARTSEPNPMPHQYIGTILDSILPQLCIAANLLDGGNRSIQSFTFKNWISCMGMIHRSFYSMLHIAIELGVCNIYDQCNLKVTPSAAKKICRYLKKL